MPFDVAERLEVDRRVLTATAEIVAAVTPDRLDGPSPCGDWTLRELLGHMVASNEGFAASAAGKAVGAEVWDRLSYDGEPFEAYQESAEAVSAAFEGADPEVRLDVFGYGKLPLSTCLGMHIVDFVVHGWDVARSIGWAGEIDPELVAAADEIMRAFPDGPRPSAAFGVKVPVPDDASRLDKLMGFLGRDPGWTPGR
jgi:uncharacterized protein (TIGR03086 family)